MMDVHIYKSLFSLLEFLKLRVLFFARNYFWDSATLNATLKSQTLYLLNPKFTNANTDIS